MEVDAAQHFLFLLVNPKGPGVIHALAGLANAKENCWPMLLIGGASDTMQDGMMAFQEESQVEAVRQYVLLLAVCQWASLSPVIRSVECGPVTECIYVHASSMVTCTGIASTLPVHHPLTGFRFSWTERSESQCLEDQVRFTSTCQETWSTKSRASQRCSRCPHSIRHPAQLLIRARLLKQ